MDTFLLISLVFFVFLIFNKLMIKINKQKAYWDVFILSIIISIISIIWISIEEFNTFKIYVMPQLQENSVLSICVAIVIFYLTLTIVYGANLILLELWWKIEQKFKR